MPMPMPTPIIHRLAEKYHVKRVNQAMEEQFREMGMSSVVFVAFTRPDGKLSVDM
jgi:hypothetical protein